ncbi:carcinine hydrolase/isopenicillin-N N-acyltransferase family protein [Bacillus sp. SL00103]
MRNYDFSPIFDDMRLVTTHLKGLPYHTGSSSSLFGRSDGMNEHGLLSHSLHVVRRLEMNQV